MPPLEIHPFPPFVPEAAHYLMLGTFPGRATTQTPIAALSPEMWSYAGRNQFWPILAAVYGRELVTKAQKQGLFTELGMAKADIIYACRRANNDNSDANLTDITYNTEALEQLFAARRIERVFCTSQTAAKPFYKLFPDVPHVVLPSPSPRYARMTFAQKVGHYREMLPPLVLRA